MILVVCCGDLVRIFSLTIETYSEHKYIEITDLFHSAVHNIDPASYTCEQKEAWAPTPPDYDFWFSRLNEKKPFLAIVGDRVAGFLELESNGHIDCAYTHPDFQRIGIASKLLDHSVAEAVKMNITRLYVEASLIAKPFFESLGFHASKKIRLNERALDL